MANLWQVWPAKVLKNFISTCMTNEAGLADPGISWMGIATPKKTYLYDLPYGGWKKSCTS